MAPVLLNPSRFGGGAVSAAYDTAVLADGPLAFLPFRDTSGAVAVDASGNSRNFAIANMGAYNQAGLYTGGASLDFNGANSQVSIPSAGWMSASGSFSVEAWIRPDANSFNAIAAKDIAGGGWALYIGPTLNAFVPGGGNSHVGATTVTTGAAHHCVMTYDHPTTTIKLYLDSLLDGTFTQAIGVAGGTTDLLVGVSTGSNGGASRFFWFDGRMAAFAFYGSALSAARVAAHYAAA